jgi:ankyrin repeat protein
MTAALQGHESVVRELLAVGADPGLVNVDHRTARDLASLANRPGIVALLRR